MKIGDLRHRVTIEKKSQVADGGGGYTVSWVPIATVWGYIRPMRGREKYQAQQVQSDITHIVQLRYDASWLSFFNSLLDMAGSARLNYRGRIFEILSAIDIEERHSVIECECKEVLSG